MVDYTPDELRRGRFLRHFFGYEKRIDDDPTEEIVAIPAGEEVSFLRKGLGESGEAQLMAS